MKTTKLILSIVLVALATAVYGQQTFSMERFFPSHTQQVQSFLAENHTENSRIEIWKHNPDGRSSLKTSWNVYESPMVARTIFVEEADVVYEGNLELEGWMIVPFEKELNEAELALEPWMAAPFETSKIETDLVVESWMTSPFESAEVIEIEDWMTSTWY